MQLVIINLPYKKLKLLGAITLFAGVFGAWHGYDVIGWTIAAVGLFALIAG